MSWRSCCPRVWRVLGKRGRRVGDADYSDRFAYVENGGSDAVRYGVVEATRLVFQGAELFSTPPQFITQDDGTYRRTGQVRWRAWEGEADAPSLRVETDTRDLGE